MSSKLAGISLVVLMSAVASSYADGGRSNNVESAADKLFSSSLPMSRSLGISPETDAQSCRTNGTAYVTIYSTNGDAQEEIDVLVDGSPIGSLTTYFPGNGPGCKSPSADGVITIRLPAGAHTLEADSPNVSWPTHNFSVEQCQCMVMPLS